MEVPETLRAKLWAAVSRSRAIRTKEMQEACAFYDCVRKDARKVQPELVIDVCGGHGALGMLFLAHGLAKEALVIDRSEPASHKQLRQAWDEFLPKSIAYDQRPLQEALPCAVQEKKRLLVVACHACQHLARQIIDCCLGAQVAFAVCPCCPKDGSIQAAAKALNVDFPTAMVLAELGRLSGLGCAVHLRTFDAEISPQNRVLLGRPGLALEREGERSAEERLRRAYDRAHHPSSSEGRAAGLWSNQEVVEGEQELAKKIAAVQALLTPVTGAAWEQLEIRESPRVHYRARTVVAVGAHTPTDGESGGLFRLVPKEKGFQIQSTISTETLLPEVAAALPVLADILPQYEGLRCVKLHGTVSAQLLVCLVFGPGAELPSDAALEDLRAGLLGGLVAVRELVVLASAKGLQRGVPPGRDFVDEVLDIPGRGSVRYRQPFGQFSNPNPHIAIATAEWLGDVVQSITGDTPMDLLELYCGCGSHTLCLARCFRHVLAVEISRRLVEAAQYNVTQNGLDNVTVLRAPSEDFCRRVLRKKSYELREGEVKVQLNFGCTVVDPPRAGLDSVTLEAVAGYDHILYVSCNPKALSSNLETRLSIESTSTPTAKSFGPEMSEVRLEPSSLARHALTGRPETGRRALVGCGAAARIERAPLRIEAPPNLGDVDFDVAAREKRPEDYGVDTLKITDDDAAFILGKGGKTKEKIARVSQAEIELFERDLILEIRGSKVQRRRAKKYCEGVMAQRTGPVNITEEYNDDDLTMLMVPQETVGFVTGRAGNFLRTIEEEWGTLMFFCEVGSGRRDKDYEKLAIFGDIRGRRGAELKVLSAIETKTPGYLSKIKNEVIDRDKGKDPEGTWSTDTMTFQDDELSYALGKQGGTRKKLERASGCIVQYVGHTALFSGTRTERRRAKDYMKWLFAQLEGPVYVDGWEDRDDCCVVHVPSDCIGYITGSRRATLGRMEEEWGTLMFFMTKDGEKGGRSGQAEKLIICGHERGRRGAELKCMNEIEKKAPGHFSRGLREKFSDSRNFDTDRMAIKEDELSYVIGKEAATQKKIEKAAGCILQFVGRYAFMAGILKERRRCKEYIGWLLQQLKGAVTIPDVSDRDDCTEMHIPANCKGWVTGNRGSELRRMEHETATYMFMALDGRGDERLCIFCHEQGSKVSTTGRMAAERLVNELVQEKLRGDEDDRGRGRSDSRKRSPPRRDSRRRSPARRSPSYRGGGGGRRDSRARNDSRRR
ncbi:unnamed protein product [Effrenium voratum]|nr:unnamed protein product [Effrenium voratum]